MKRNNRKLVLGILSVFLLIAIFLIILLFNRSGQSNKLSTTSQSKTITNTNSVIYGDVSKEDTDRQQSLLNKSNSKNNETSPETIFDSKKDTSAVGSYNIDKPVAVEGTNFPGANNLISANKDYIFSLDLNNELIYYDKSKNITLSLEKNVIDAKFSNEKKLIFEKKVSNGYALYLFDYSNFNNIDEQLVVLQNPAVDFGYHNGYYYFSIKEQPGKYYIGPTPDNTAAAESPGYKEVNANLITPSIKGFIAINRDNGSVNNLGFGANILSSSPFQPIDNKYLFETVSNPYATDQDIYLTLYSEAKEDNLAETVGVNNIPVSDVNNIADAKWMDRETILYTESSDSQRLYLYNFRTKEKYLLANDVTAFIYNDTDNSVYYLVAGRNTLSKIVIDRIK